jgi:hypothetical protein
MNSPNEWMRAIDATIANQVAIDLAWWDRQRKGRWIVVEPKYPRRGWRFSQLSVARSFARRFGGIVRHFRQRDWKQIDHWAHPIATMRGTWSATWSLVAGALAVDTAQ